MLALINGCFKVPARAGVAAGAGGVVSFAELAVGHGTADHESGASVGSEVVRHD